MKTKIIAWIIALLVLTNLAFALGLSPAEKGISYSPGENITLTYKIVNNENRDMDIIVYPLGQLADYISFEQDIIHLNSEEPVKKIKAFINLPAGLEPGKNYGKIVIEEDILEKDSETGVYAKLRVISKLKVDVPFPDKYLRADIEIRNKSKEKPLEISAKVLNLGKEDIEEVKAEFGIFNKDQKVTDLKTDSESLSVGETKELLTTLNTTGYRQGLYSAIAKVTYDNQELEIGRDFIVGDKNIEILDYTKYFIQGKVNKFDIEVENQWNKKIRNAFALVYIDGFEKIKSMSYDLDPWQIRTITSYWDTTSVGLGDYDSNVSMNYENKSTVKSGKVHVIEEAELKELMNKDNTPYALIAVIAFILMNSIWIILLKLKK